MADNECKFYATMTGKINNFLSIKKAIHANIISFIQKIVKSETEKKSTDFFFLIYQYFH